MYPNVKTMLEVIFVRQGRMGFYNYTKQKIVITYQIDFGDLCFINDVYKGVKASHIYQHHN